MKRRVQPWPIRATHWLNAVCLVIMVASGFGIFAAFPSLGPKGALYAWYPLQGHKPPSWLQLGGWLAGARHYHFAFAWIFVGNGLVYLTYFFASGEWHRRLFLPTRDATNAIETVKFYLRIRKTAPEQGLYNGLQRLGYTSAWLLAIGSIVSGLAIYKPTQLHLLVAAMGGYDAARVVHLAFLCALVGFTLGHLLMVALHPKTFVDIVTGGARE